MSRKKHEWKRCIMCHGKNTESQPIRGHHVYPKKWFGTTKEGNDRLYGLCEICHNEFHNGGYLQMDTIMGSAKYCEIFLDFLSQGE